MLAPDARFSWLQQSVLDLCLSNSVTEPFLQLAESMTCEWWMRWIRWIPIMLAFAAAERDDIVMLQRQSPAAEGSMTSQSDGSPAKSVVFYNLFAKEWKGHNWFPAKCLKMFNAPQPNPNQIVDDLCMLKEGRHVPFGAKNLGQPRPGRSRCSKSCRVGARSIVQTWSWAPRTEDQHDWSDHWNFHAWLECHLGREGHIPSLWGGQRRCDPARYLVLLPNCTTISGQLLRHIRGLVGIPNPEGILWYTIFMIVLITVLYTYIRIYHII